MIVIKHLDNPCCVRGLYSPYHIGHSAPTRSSEVHRSHQGKKSMRRESIGYSYDFTFPFIVIVVPGRGTAGSYCNVRRSYNYQNQVIR